MREQKLVCSRQMNIIGVCLLILLSKCPWANSRYCDVFFLLIGCCDFFFLRRGMRGRKGNRLGGFWTESCACSCLFCFFSSACVFPRPVSCMFCVGRAWRQQGFHPWHLVQPHDSFFVVGFSFCLSRFVKPRFVFKGGDAGFDFKPRVSS